MALGHATISSPFVRRLTNKSSEQELTPVDFWPFLRQEGFEKRKIKFGLIWGEYASYKYNLREGISRVTDDLRLNFHWVAW